MAFRLTKDEISQRGELVESLDEASGALDQAIVAFNLTMKEAFAPVMEAQEAYNEAVREAQEFIDAVRVSRESEFEAKSEKWQESSSGEAASAWMEEWSLTMDEADLEQPEPLDPPDLELGEQLEALPDKIEKSE